VSHLVSCLRLFACVLLLSLSQEYGIAVVDKLTIGSKMCSALLEKVPVHILQHITGSALPTSPTVLPITTVALINVVLHQRVILPIYSYG
jgi:hypothetical protein